jgi:hypothetical protein
MMTSNAMPPLLLVPARRLSGFVRVWKMDRIHAQLTVMVSGQTLHQ